MPTFNNAQIASFYTGQGPYRNAMQSNMGRMRRPGRLGSITSASVTSSPGTGGATSVPTAGGSLQSTATSIAQIGNTASNLVKGWLQAEAAQNAINAQKNLTAALTPGMITIILGALVYMMVAKK